ncbi:uncharacterized protein [Lepidochelys kempii]|uniref:uncharacterized protein n=1 Tax=Lepidochelys kempii TaxID=8472 RepID=UPI003C6FBEDB
MAMRRLLSGTSESSSKAEKRLLRILRKKALQVAPEPEGSSCHLSQEQSGPFVPSGGEGVPGRARRWKRPAFWWRKPAPSAGTEELIEELPDISPPSAILTNSLIPVGNLSTTTAALEPELETHLLRAAPHAVFTLGTEKDTTHLQDLHRVLPNLMDALLGNLLVESPDSDRLHDILEPMNYWIMSRVSQERARANRSSTALLRFTITLPELDLVDHPVSPPCLLARQGNSSGHHSFQPALGLENEEVGEQQLATMNIHYASLYHLEQQEASHCPVTEDVPASRRQEVEEPCPSISSSARSPWDSSSAGA